MDIFSGVKDLTQKTHNLDSITNVNTNQIQKSQKISDQQKDILQSQDKEKIKKELQNITEELNKALNPLNTTLKFHFNDKVDELTVKVIDTKTDKVIREYPPKEALELMQKMKELVGLLFDKKG